MCKGTPAQYYLDPVYFSYISFIAIQLIMGLRKYSYILYSLTADLVQPYRCLNVALLQPDSSLTVRLNKGHISRYPTPSPGNPWNILRNPRESRDPGESRLRNAGIAYTYKQRIYITISYIYTKQIHEYNI